MVLAFAGCVVLLGVALAHFVNPWWIGLSIFAGLNMIQAAFTGFCPPSLILGKLGWLDADGTIHWGGKR